MNNSDLARELAARRALSEKAAQRVVDTLVQGWIAALQAGDRIEIRGSGSFGVRSYILRVPLA